MKRKRGSLEVVGVVEEEGVVEEVEEEVEEVVDVGEEEEETEGVVEEEEVGLVTEEEVGSAGKRTVTEDLKGRDPSVPLLGEMQEVRCREEMSLILVEGGMRGGSLMFMMTKERSMGA